MKMVSIIGHFAFGLEFLDGQTVKTKVLANELECRLGECEVSKLDTHGGFKTLIKAPFQAISALKESKNVIILPAHNGIRAFGRLLPLFGRFFKKRKIHYVVIGGWLPAFLEKNKSLAKSLKKFDGIYVETNTMKTALEAQGFENVFVMPNCKDLKVLTYQQLVYATEPPYKLCTFSRVMKEKGIEDAVNAVKVVNKELGYTAYTLDIYGQVDGAQMEWFEEQKSRFPDFIKYCGVVSFDKTVEVLSNYFALLFPTHYYTEGIPGTIIDAYAAGVPVISARWESFDDMIDDGVTGIGYELGSVDALKDKLCEAYGDSVAFSKMKVNCLKKSKCFAPAEAIAILVDLMKGDQNGDICIQA